MLAELVLRQLMGGMEHARLYRIDPAEENLCVTLAPGMQVDYTGWLLRIPAVRLEANAHGFRGPARLPLKPRGVLRVAALGDSFVYGLGVTDGFTIPAKLEAALSEALDARVEVLNFGLPGASLRDSIGRLRQLACRWKPDHVLFFLYTDDLNESLCDWSSTARIVAGVLGSYSYLARSVLIAYRLAYGQLAGRREEHAAERLGQEISDLARAARACGAELAIVALGDPSASAQSGALGNRLARLDVPWLDARAWLDGASDQALPTIPGEFHFAPEGTTAAARRIARWLVTLPGIAGDAGERPLPRQGQDER